MVDKHAVSSFGHPLQKVGTNHAFVVTVNNDFDTAAMRPVDYCIRASSWDLNNDITIN